MRGLSVGATMGKYNNSTTAPSTPDQGHRKMTCVFCDSLSDKGGRQEALVYLFVVITVHEMVKIVL